MNVTVKFYKTIQNILIFFFIWALFRRAMIIGGGAFIDEFSAALAFGLITAFTPNILKFFKLPVNIGSTLLITLIVTFLYLFIQISILNYINLTGQSINFGIELIGPINLEDKTYALVLLSILLSLMSVTMDYLKKK